MLANEALGQSVERVSIAKFYPELQQMFIAEEGTQVIRIFNHEARLLVRLHAVIPADVRIDKTKVEARQGERRPVETRNKGIYTKEQLRAIEREKQRQLDVEWAKGVLAGPPGVSLGITSRNERRHAAVIMAQDQSRRLGITISKRTPEERAELGVRETLRRDDGPSHSRTDERSERITARKAAARPAHETDPLRPGDGFGDEDHDYVHRDVAARLAKTEETMGVIARRNGEFRDRVRFQKQRQAAKEAILDRMRGEEVLAREKRRLQSDALASALAASAAAATTARSARSARGDRVAKDDRLPPESVRTTAREMGTDELVPDGERLRIHPVHYEPGPTGRIRDLGAPPADLASEGGAGGPGAESRSRGVGGKRTNPADLDEVVSVLAIDYCRARPRTDDALLWQRQTPDQVVHLLAVSSTDMTISFWRTRNFAFHSVIHTVEPQAALCWSSTANLLFTAGTISPVISGWDVLAQRKICSLRQHEETILCIAALPAHNLVASAGLDRVIRLWDVGDDKLPRVPTHVGDLHGHRHGVQYLVPIPHNGMLLSGGTQPTEVFVWDVATRAKLLHLKGHKETLIGVAVMPNPPYLAITADCTGCFKFWHVDDSTTVAALPVLTLHGRQGDFVFQSFLVTPPHRSFLAIGRHFHLHRPKSLRDADPVPTVVLYSDTSEIFLVAADSDVRLFDAFTGRFLREFQDVMPEPIVSMCLDRRERKVLIGDAGGLLRVFNCLDGYQLKEADHPHSDDVTGLEIAGPEGYFITTSWDREIRVYSDHSAEEFPCVRLVENAHDADISCLAFHREIGLIATGAADGTVRLWSFTDLAFVDDLEGHSDAITDVEFALPSALPVLFSCDAGGCVLVWSVPPSILGAQLLLRIVNQGPIGQPPPPHVDLDAPAPPVAVLPAREQQPVPIACIEVVCRFEDEEAEATDRSGAFHCWVFVGDGQGRISWWDLSELIAQFPIGEVPVHKRVPQLPSYDPSVRKHRRFPVNAPPAFDPSLPGAIAREQAERRRRLAAERAEARKKERAEAEEARRVAREAKNAKAARHEASAATKEWAEKMAKKREEAAAKQARENPLRPGSALPTVARRMSVPSLSRRQSIVALDGGDGSDSSRRDSVVGEVEQSILGGGVVRDRIRIRRRPFPARAFRSAKRSPDWFFAGDSARLAAASAANADEDADATEAEERPARTRREEELVAGGGGRGLAAWSGADGAEGPRVPLEEWVESRTLADVLPRAQWTAHVNVITSLLFVANPPSLVSSSPDASVRVWGLDGTPVGVLMAPERPPLRVHIPGVPIRKSGGDGEDEEDDQPTATNLYKEDCPWRFRIDAQEKQRVRQASARALIERSAARRRLQLRESRRSFRATAAEFRAALTAGNFEDLDDFPEEDADEEDFREDGDVRRLCDGADLDSFLELPAPAPAGGLVSPSGRSSVKFPRLPLAQSAPPEWMSAVRATPSVLLAKGAADRAAANLKGDSAASSADADEQRKLRHVAHVLSLLGSFGASSTAHTRAGAGAAATGEGAPSAGGGPSASPPASSRVDTSVSRVLQEAERVMKELEDERVAEQKRSEAFAMDRRLKRIHAAFDEARAERDADRRLSWASLHSLPGNAEEWNKLPHGLEMRPEMMAKYPAFRKELRGMMDGARLRKRATGKDALELGEAEAGTASSSSKGVAHGARRASSRPATAGSVHQAPQTAAALTAPSDDTETVARSSVFSDPGGVTPADLEHRPRPVGFALPAQPATALRPAPLLSSARSPAPASEPPVPAPASWATPVPPPPPPRRPEALVRPQSALVRGRQSMSRGVPGGGAGAGGAPPTPPHGLDAAREPSPLAASATVPTLPEGRAAPEASLDGVVGSFGRTSGVRPVSAAPTRSGATTARTFAEDIERFHTVMAKEEETIRQTTAHIRLLNQVRRSPTREPITSSRPASAFEGARESRPPRLVLSRPSSARAVPQAPTADGIPLRFAEYVRLRRVAVGSTAALRALPARTSSLPLSVSLSRVPADARPSAAVRPNVRLRGQGPLGLDRH